MSPDIAASVRARLLDQAKQRGEEFERTLARFAAERLLYRLGASAARDEGGRMKAWGGRGQIPVGWEVAERE